MNTMDESLDDTLIKALSNPERKNILRIVASHPEGLNYTGILEESELSTGRLNYHLGALTGFLEKRDERLYSLTELGKTAIAVLDFMLEDVGASVLNSMDKRKAKRLESIQRSMDYGFYFLVFISIGITAYMGTIAENSGPTWDVLMGFWVMFAIGLIYFFNRFRKKDAEKILWLLDWVKSRFFGNYRMQGQV
jgi:DNA-binding transcriptional ArsR family regulator